MVKLLILAVPFLLLVPQDKGKQKLAWNLPKGRVWEFKKLDKAGRPLKDGGWWIFASELGADGSNRLLVDRYADIPYALAFTLPKEERKAGEAWEHTSYFFHESSDTSGSGWMGGGGSIKPVCAKGRFLFRKLDKKSDGDLAILEGAFELFEIRRDYANNERRLTVTKNNFGSLRVDVIFNIGLGRIQKAAWAGSVRAQERVPDKDRDFRIVEQKLDFAGGIEFAEEVELTRDRMEKAAAEQVRKAVEWLKKQQRAPGDFGTGAATESFRVEFNQTGLAVRALAAGGVAPTDPAMEKALKVLRGAPGSSTMSLAEAIFDIALREPAAKEDAALLKSLSGALLNRRDAKLGAWPTTTDKDAVFNPISTSHALKALWAVGRTGQETPIDLWRNVLETLAFATTEDDAANLELKLGFEEGAGLPLADGPKQAKPVTWRYDFNAKTDDFRLPSRGYGFTVVAALECLKLASLELEKRKQLTDAQKRSIDGAMRQGLAWIQARHSWRGAAPAEASWSVRRIEFISAQARVLALYGITSLDGIDWWLEAAYHLLRLQSTDGSWDESGGGPVLETAHAILVLTKPWPVK